MCRMRCDTGQFWDPVLVLDKAHDSHGLVPGEQGGHQQGYR